MENKTELKFKTNLNCGGCVSKVQSDLDNVAGISHWSVDTNNEDKLLTVNSTGITEVEIVNLLKAKGFKATPYI